MRRAFPSLVEEGFVVIHSAAGSLDRPKIDQANPSASVLRNPNRALVRVANAQDLADEAYTFLSHGDCAHAVDLVVLRALPGMML